MTTKQFEKLNELLIEYYTEKYEYYPTTIEKVVRKISWQEAVEEDKKEEQTLINWLFGRNKKIYTSYSKYVGLTFKQ